MVLQKYKSNWTIFQKKKRKKGSKICSGKVNVKDEIGRFCLKEETDVV